MGILAMKFLPIGLWRIDEVNLLLTYLTDLLKKLAMKFFPIGLWKYNF